jgi:hypothetical protein
MSQGANEWARDPTQEDDDDDDDDDEIVYDDDEDEFGLPSLASMRRKKAATSKSKNLDSGGTMEGNPTSLGFGLAAANRQRANSSDIAEERGTPMYPTARKHEGKILRPQYKDILQGQSFECRLPRVLRFTGYTDMCGARSCKRIESHQPLVPTYQCLPEGERNTFQPHYAHQQVQAHSTGQHGISY